MNEIAVKEEFQSLINSIYLIENSDPNKKTSLPIFADGFPGIVISHSENPFVMLPRNKLLSDFYLYGLTIEPIQLETTGKFNMFIFKLHPFVVRFFWDISPSELNDDCLDLSEISSPLPLSIDSNELPEMVFKLLRDRLKIAGRNPNSSVLLAISIIVASKGNVAMKKVCSQLFVHERTFERNFLTEVGVRPKQFAAIVRFNFSIGKISDEDQATLTEIGYSSGYSDQSHFIRNFKKFVGTTPKEFQNQMQNFLYPSLKTGRIK